MLRRVALVRTDVSEEPGASFIRVARIGELGTTQAATSNRRKSLPSVKRHNIYRLLVGKPEGKRPQGRPRRRWIDNIKMDILEIGLNVVDWIGLAQDSYRWRALVNSVKNLGVP
jgi:hypothetical protein